MHLLAEIKLKVPYYPKCSSENLDSSLTCLDASADQSNAFPGCGGPAA